MTAKLEYTNNWEHDEYWINGKRVKSLSLVYINGEELPVVSKKITVAYTDMGHRYSSTSTHFFVEVEAFGLKHLIDLNKIVDRATVYAIVYSIKP